MGEFFKVLSNEDLIKQFKDRELEHKEFIYEAVKLKKIMGQRYLNQKKIEGLDSVKGMELINPDNVPKQSFFHTMAKSGILLCKIFLLLLQCRKKGIKNLWIL